MYYCICIMMYAIDFRYILNLILSKISFSFNNTSSDFLGLNYVPPPNPKDTRYIYTCINVDVGPLDLKKYMYSCKVS